MKFESTSAVTARASRFARSPHLGDLIVAGIAFALTLAWLGYGSGASRHLDLLGVVLAAIASLPLVARRRAPLLVLAVTTAASTTINGLGYALGPPFGPTIALFYVASDERTRARLPATAIVLLALFALHVGGTAITRGSAGVPILSGVIVWGGAWIAGDQLRQRRQRRADLEERARRAERDLERERRLAAAEERTRIARDLHDSAAHSINVILVQAGAARLLQRRDPDEAEHALTTIEEVARETIGEIDQLIRGLRENGTTAITEDAIEPPTGLAALQTLAERYRAAGQQISITISGRSRPLAPGLDQAAYRILQESLTNAARHGSGPAEVAITYGESDLQLSISNPTQTGVNGERADAGHGILGMRERAALLGGDLHARRHDADFRVEARLPYLTPGQR
jgi:signal transduction histidine kinase